MYRKFQNVLFHTEKTASIHAVFTVSTRHVKELTAVVYIVVRTAKNAMVYFSV